MDKRLLNFMLVSMLVFIGYMEFIKFTNPPPPPADEGGAPAEKQPPENGNPAPVADAADVDATVPANTIAEQTPDAEVEPTDEPESPAAENMRFTIGSIDPASGYPMLVTFNSQGAAVERIELSDPRYRDLEDKTAYIGHLALSSDDRGAKVNVVGPGTPAALSGIQVDDVIVKIGTDGVTTPASAKLALAKFKYGANVPVEILRNGSLQTLTLESIRRPLEVVRPEALPESDQLQQLSYLLTLHQVGHKRADFDQDEIANLPSLRNSDWHADLVEDNGDTKVEFRFPLTASNLEAIGLKGSLEVIKRFWLSPRIDENAESQYHFDFEVEIVNKGSENIEVGYRIDGPTGLPLEGWWYSYKTHPTGWSGAGVRDVVWRAVDGPQYFCTNPMITKRLKKQPESPEFIIVDSGAPQRMQYLGLDAQYFNCTLLASTHADAPPIIMNYVDGRALSEIDELRASRTPVTFRADSVPILVSPDQPAEQQFEIFAGPKAPAVLEPYNLSECIVYGWFKWPAQLMGMLLHGLYSVVRNYGLAIILLTVLVRACMFPIGRQQAMNAKKMQELTPEIKKIKEKFPADTEKQAKAQQELFRKHKYNPVAGCLPMFLQLPIFIGLYRALSVDIELRQTPLIPGLDWCANLAAPDMLFRWDNMIPFEALTGYAGYLGPFMNLLPLISTGLFLVHQQMFTPPPTDEQQEMQQKVMKFMMLFMLVIFFKVPAGLCLYFITSSLWALAERMLLPKDAKKTEETPISLSKQPATVGVSGKDDNSAAVAAKKKRRKRKK